MFNHLAASGRRLWMMSVARVEIQSNYIQHCYPVTHQQNKTAAATNNTLVVERILIIN
jgi:hypothetical protein